MVEKLSLKALRAINNMSQGEVAEKVGVSRDTYGNWERGECVPNAIQFIKLAEIFNCSLDNIFFPLNTR